MTMWMLLAVAAAPPGGSGPETAYRACLGGTARVAAQAGRVPEEMPALLAASCARQRARLVGKVPDVEADALLASYVRRYAVFHATGAWPSR